MAIQCIPANTHLQCTALNFTNSTDPFSITCWIRANWSQGGRRSYVGVYGSSTSPIVPGISGAYFANQNLTDPPTLTRQDSAIDFNWAAGSPDASIPVNNFSVRWSGFIRAPETGTYLFRLRTDDGCRLFINGQQLINDWFDRAAANSFASFFMTAGASYEIVVEYYENGGLAVAELSWQPPSASDYTIIPALSGNAGLFTVTLAPTTALQIGTTAGNGELTCWTWGGATLVGIGAGSMTAFNNQWVLISYTFDGTTHRLYRNDVQVATSTTAPSPGKFYWVYINGYPTSATGEVADHQVDSYTYFGRTISPGEIQTIFSSRGARNGIVQGTLAKYDFDEHHEGQQILEVADISGNRANLSLVGTGSPMTYVYANTTSNANLRPVQ